jgi:hypothetical protein
MNGAIDDAFQYLTHVVGRRGYAAASALGRALQQEALTATCHRSVNGKPVSAGPVNPTFWFDHLKIELVESRAVVTPMKAIETGEYIYTVSQRAVRSLWPPATPSTAPGKGGGKSP